MEEEEAAAAVEVEAVQVLEVEVVRMAATVVLRCTGAEVATEHHRSCREAGM